MCTTDFITMVSSVVCGLNNYAIHRACLEKSVSCRPSMIVDAQTTLLWWWVGVPSRVSVWKCCLWEERSYEDKLIKKNLKFNSNWQDPQRELRHVCELDLSWVSILTADGFYFSLVCLPVMMVFLLYLCYCWFVMLA